MLRSEMMERMPSSEFFEWMVLEQLEPFGDKRGDIQAAIIAQTMANIHRDPKTEPYKLDVFLPKFAADPPKPIKTMSADEQMEMMLLIQSMQNANVNPS